MTNKVRCSALHITAKTLLFRVFAICILIIGWGCCFQAYAGDSSKQIIDEMQDGEIELYEQAETLTTKLKVTTIKLLNRDQFNTYGIQLAKTNVMVEEILQLYGKMLQLRVSKTHQLKKHVSSSEAGEWIEMVSFDPELLTDVFNEFLSGIPLERMKLTWQQKLTILGIMHRGKQADLTSEYAVKRSILLIRQELSKEVSDKDRLDTLVKGIINSQRKMFVTYNELDYELVGLLNVKQTETLGRWAWSLIK